MNRRLTDESINGVDQPTSSDECMADSETFALRKKMRKRRRKNSPDIGDGSKKAEAIDAISDSHSDEITNINDSDSSETFIQATILGRLHAAANDGKNVLQTIADSHLIDLLSGAENDGSYSSPLSNKSEKNMGDFDEDEESPCEEELAQLASSTHALEVSLKKLPTRPLIIGDTQMPKIVVKTGSVSSSTVKSSATSVSSNTGHTNIILKPITSAAGLPFTYRITDVCKPGNTLLWDLLMDDKIVRYLFIVLVCFCDSYPYFSGSIGRIPCSRSRESAWYASLFQHRTSNTHQVYRGMPSKSSHEP